MIQKANRATVVAAVFLLVISMVRIHYAGRTGDDGVHVLGTKAFSAMSSNSGNTFSAASAFPCAAVTLTADADAYVDRSAASTNYGSDPYTRSAGEQTLLGLLITPKVQRALIHFNLPQLGGCILRGATLRVHANSGSTDGGFRNVQAWRAAAAWSESTVTWNNQPATTGTAVTTQAVSGPVAFNVTTAVSNMYAATAGDSSFLLRYESEGGTGGNRWWTDWTSRESSTNKPLLELTFQ